MGSLTGGVLHLFSQNIFVYLCRMSMSSGGVMQLLLQLRSRSGSLYV